MLVVVTFVIMTFVFVSMIGAIVRCLGLVRL
jgi:hypothetical protein